MQIMVELYDGTVHLFEKLEIIGYNPMIVLVFNNEKYEATVVKARRIFTQRKNNGNKRIMQ